MTFEKKFHVAGTHECASGALGCFCLGGRSLRPHSFPMDSEDCEDSPLDLPGASCDCGSQRLLALFSYRLEECHEITWCLDRKGKPKNVSFIPPGPVKSKQWASGPLQGAVLMYWMYQDNGKKKDESLSQAHWGYYHLAVFQNQLVRVRARREGWWDSGRKRPCHLVKHPPLMGLEVMVEIKIGSQEGKGQKQYFPDGLGNQD